MVGMWYWDTAPRGPRRYLALLDASGLRCSRGLVPQPAFHRHPYDLMGSHEQYARKHHDAVYSPVCVAMPFKPEKPDNVLLLFVCYSIWPQYVLRDFDQRSSRAVSSCRAITIHAA